MGELGRDIHLVLSEHLSHADATQKAVIERLHSTIVSDEWPVIRLADGESFTPIAASIADSYSLSVFCTKELEEDTTYTHREDGEQALGLDVRYVGAFKDMEDAKFVLEHILYRQADLVGYEVAEEEDLHATKLQTFDANRNPLATYTYGGHRPGGAKYQEACRFTSGEKALAVCQAPYYAVVPVKIIGPITPDSERESWELNDTKDYYGSFEEYVNDCDDWYWDSVAVHPLVYMKSFTGQMTDTEVVPRVYLFPYKPLGERREDPTSV